MTIFILLCLFSVFIGVEKERTPIYIGIFFFCNYQFLSAITSEDFWRMQKDMRYKNTQVFGVNGGEFTG